MSAEAADSVGGLLYSERMDYVAGAYPSYAQVVIDLPTRALSEPFEYGVGSELSDVEIGTPVVVPLGSAVAIGYVVGLSTDSTVERVRPIIDVLGPPLFDSNAIDVAAWIAEEYLAPLSESLKLFLPPGGAPRLVRGYRASGNEPPDTGTQLWERAREAGILRDTDLANDGSSEADDLAQLVKSGFLERTYSVERPRASASTERVVMLSPKAATFTPRRSAHRQRAILDALALGPVTVGELRADLGNVDAAISRLAQEGVVEVVERRRYRAPSVRRRSAEHHEHLSEGQRGALASILEPVSSAGHVVLIDGVTGSGKTEVYMRAVERVLEDDGGCIVLVPEIALTPQTVGRFRARFSDQVAVLHSRLSLGERFDEWERLRTGRARVVVGARSAVFAPVPDLRLIVIDEEHDSSYKHGASPRYHARNVALKRATLANATLVLGSATPDIESRHACESGEWHMVRMPERVSGGHLPEVRVVDMAAEFNAGHRSMFSRPLLEALEGVRGGGAKAVLLLNRRGFAPFLLCRECGFVPSCDECSVSLTYHETGRRLECHHCGATRAVPGQCPSCGSPYLRMFGAGTQRVESELALAFPDIPVVRMDADTTKGKGGHERRLSEFEELDTGILLGTQMVAKGLDYADVRLVGVLNADTALHLPDYRSAERTFQLVAQVAGRAGRGSAPGLVIVQTYWPEHPAILAAARHDAEAFCRSELKERLQLGYPPAARLADIEITSRNDSEAARVARAIADALREVVEDGWRVLGPSHACIARVKARWRWHVLLKAPPKARISDAVATTIDALRSSQEVTVSVDVDPADIL